MTKFHEQSWTEREKLLGDDAETVFSTLVGTDNCVKYGLDRPPLHVGKLPQFIRFTPDFLQEHRAVEVVGVGYDGVVKIKVDKLLALMKWNDHMPVYVFIWNSHRSDWCLLPVVQLWNSVHASGRVRPFHEGTLAWHVRVDDIGATWHVRS